MQYFKSKKNSVYLSDNIIVKDFNSDSFKNTEVAALKTLDGQYAPKLLSENNLKISMEYIDGELLIDKFLSANINDAISLAKLLSNTINFIKIKFVDMIPNDENFRNYIVKNNIIYRIDFEENTKGTIENWISKLLSFATLYDNDIEIKKAFTKELISNIKLDKKELIKDYEKELIFLSNRWKVNYPINDFESIKKVMD